MSDLDERIREAFEKHQAKGDIEDFASLYDFKAGYKAALPRWIPVSEGEPTKAGNYLVCDYDDEQTVMFHNGTTGFWQYDEVALYMDYPQPPEREEV